MFNKKLFFVFISACLLQGIFLKNHLFCDRPWSNRNFSDVIDEIKNIDLQKAMSLSLTCSNTGEYADEHLYETPLCSYLPVVYSEAIVNFLDRQEVCGFHLDFKDNSLIKLESGPFYGYQVSVDLDDVIAVFNDVTGDVFCSFSPDGFGVKSLIFIDDIRFASLSSHGDIEVWNIKKRQRELVIKDNNGINCACVLRNGALACVDKIGFVKILDLTTGNCLHQFNFYQAFSAQSIFQRQDGNLEISFSPHLYDYSIVLEIYPENVKNLTFEQYVLLVGLQNCKKNNSSIMLHNTWVSVFNTLSYVFQKKYHDYVANDDQDSDDEIV